LCLIRVFPSFFTRLSDKFCRGSDFFPSLLQLDGWKDEYRQTGRQADKQADRQGDGRTDNTERHMESWMGQGTLTEGDSSVHMTT
jgi:hypothetical protein